MSDNLDKNVIDYIKAGETIKAIKRYRELTGLGLKESKEAVDRMRFETEIKVLKSTSIDDMRNKIKLGLHIFSEHQMNFLLDLIDEAFYLGEDSGQSMGYMKALEENDSTSGGDWEHEQEEAYNEGYENGREEGYTDGQERGYEQGHRDGYSEGTDNGYEEGYEAREKEEKVN